MIRKTVVLERSCELSQSIQGVSSELIAWRVVCASLALLFLLFTASVHAAPTVASTRAAANYLNVPLSFEPNQGQADSRVQFLSRNSGYSLFLTPGEAVLMMKKQNPLAAHPFDTLRMQLLGASATAAATGLDPQSGVISYFIGNDPSKWHSGIQTFGKVRYSQIYPGIDLVFYGNQRQLEYDFIVSPGSDPDRVVWSINGAKPRIDKDGDLVLTAPGGPVRFLAPVAYQDIDGKRTAVAATYTVAGKMIGFRLGQYDHRQPLVIDPILSYFSYLGGTGNDYIGNSFPQGNGSPSPEPTQAAGIDAQGNFYVAGTTFSADFPVVAPVLPQTTKLAGQNWAFVSKFSPDGSKLLYSSYFGGTAGGNDAAYALAVDSTGNAYITGSAGTNDFPVTTGAFQTLCAPYYTGPGTSAPGCSLFGNGAYSRNAFVMKLNPTGSKLVYSTFLGGYGASWGAGIAIDGAGQAYVTGAATSSLCGGAVYTYGAQYECFPTTSNALISDIGGGNAFDMAFMTVFNAAGSGLVYSTLFGDPQGAVSVNGAGCLTDCGAVTYGAAIALDPAGNVYIGGRTVAANMIVTKGAFNTTGSGPSPSTPSLVSAPNGYGYVAKFAPVTSSGTSLIYSTYLGGGATSGGLVGGVAGDSSGNAYVTGATYAADFPATAGAYQTTCDPTQPPTFCNQDPYVAKLNPTGTGLVWATFLGYESAAPLSFLGPVIVDGSQNVYVLGEGTGKLPLGGGVLSTLNGPDTVYVAKLDPSGSQVLLGVTVGGPGNGAERAGGFAVDGSGDLYIAGSINQGGSFATPGAYQQANAGVADGFVAKFVPLQTSTTTLSLSASTTTAGQSVTLTAKVTGPTGSPIPTGTVTFDNDTTSLGTGTLDATGTATYTTSTLVASSYTLTAAYGGDSNYSSSTSSAAILTVNPIATATELVIAPNPANTGQTVTFTATVTPASGTAVPTGTVTFKNGSTQLSAAPLGATGKAVFTTSTLAAATYSVTAAYSGDSDNASSTSGAVSLIVSVAAVATSTSISASSTSAAAGTSITFTAKVTPASGTGVPSGTVTFKDGTATLGTGTLTGAGQATYSTAALAIGAHSITASYGGDSGDSTSVSSALAVTVNALATTTALTASPTSAVSGANVTFTATVAGPAGGGVPAGTVTFLSGTTTLGTGTLNASGVATYSSTALATGSDSITASYAANGVFAASVSAAVMVTVSAPPPADFSVTLNPTSSTVTNGSTATLTVTITPINGFNAATSLACSGLPTHATCTFSPASVTPSGAPATSTLTIASNTVTASAEIKPQLPRPQDRKGLTGAGRLVTSLASFFVICGLGFTSRKARRNWARYLGLLAFLAVIAGAASGCGVSKKTPPGTYSVTVTGTAGSLSHSATYSIIVK